MLACDAFTRSMCRRSHSSWQMRAAVLSPVKGPHPFNSTSLTARPNGRVVNVIIEAEINEQSGGQKEEISLPKRLAKEASSGAPIRGRCSRWHRFREGPLRGVTVWTDTEAQGEARRGQRKGQGAGGPLDNELEWNRAKGREWMVLPQTLRYSSSPLWSQIPSYLFPNYLRSLIPWIPGPWKRLTLRGKHNVTGT